MIESSAHISRLCIPDPEGLEGAIRGSELEPWLLSGHRQQSTLSRMMLPGSCLDQVEIGPALWFRGVMPKDCYTMVYVHASPREGHSFNFGRSHHGRCLGFYAPGETVDGTSPEGYRNATLTIPKDLFEAVVDREYRELPQSLLKRGRPFLPTDGACRSLEGLLAEVGEVLHDAPDAFADDTARHSLESALRERFFQLMLNDQEDSSASAGLSISKRYRRMALVLDFIRENQHRPIHLKELCEVSGLSRRGLEYLMRDLLGVRLGTMLRLIRMHGVRRELLAVDPECGWVKRSALEWGFWHLGRFAAEYRAHYGESPSDTLARRAG